MVITLNEPEIENGSKIAKKTPLCPKCKAELRQRIRRGFLFKQMFGWLPVRRYYCYKCLRKRYIWG